MKFKKFYYNERQRSNFKLVCLDISRNQYANDSFHLLCAHKAMQVRIRPKVYDPFAIVTLTELNRIRSDISDGLHNPVAISGAPSVSVDTVPNVARIRL